MQDLNRTIAEVHHRTPPGARTEPNPNVVTYTGATVNGVQTQAEVLMQRHTPHEWPMLKDGLAQWEAQTRDLKAVDFPIPLHALEMNRTTGGLYDRLKNPQGVNPTTGVRTQGVIPTHTALAHLVSYASDTPGACVENLEHYSPAIRAQMLQELLVKTPMRDVTLRTALLSKGAGAMPDTRVIRAVVSEKHSQEHGDDLAVIAELNKLTGVEGARIRVVKQWDYSHVEVFLPNKFTEVKKGRKVYGRLSFRNSETKGGSYEASVGSLDLWCLNGAVAAGNGTSISIRHVGDIRYKMAASARTMTELVDHVLHEQAETYKMALPGTRAEVIERIVKAHKLPADSGSALSALWDVDGIEQGGGHTVAGAVNAVTRYAQSLPVERAIAVETIAGRIQAAGLSAFL